MLPGDRLICALVDSRPEKRFTHWPLHLTIVPWFRVADPSKVVATGLERALTGTQPFEVVMQGQAMFGAKKNRQVALVQLPTPLAEIEQKVRTYLHKKRAWIVDETTKKHYEFRPHVTAQGEKRLQDEDVFMVERLYVIEQKGPYKEIVSEVSLG